MKYTILGLGDGTCEQNGLINIWTTEDCEAAATALGLFDQTVCATCPVADNEDYAFKGCYQAKNSFDLFNVNYANAHTGASQAVIDANRFLCKEFVSPLAAAAVAAAVAAAADAADAAAAAVAAAARDAGCARPAAVAAAASAARRPPLPGGHARHLRSRSNDAANRLINAIGRTRGPGRPRTASRRTTTTRRQLPL